MTTMALLSTRLKLSGQDLKAAWAAVIENARKRDACPRHHFPQAGDRKFGDKVTCERCGATLNLGEALAYVAGFRAAGGAPDAVWPGPAPEPHR